MADDKNGLRAKIMEQLGTVIEPELHRDLVTLDTIKDLKVEGNSATFTIVLTTPACPLKDVMERQAREAVLRVEGIDTVTVNFDANVPSNSRIMGQLNLPIKSLIAVSSGKGGVGKSTVAANIAVALNQSSASVGLMDADILGPNLPTMMGVDKIPPPANQRLIPAEVYGIRLMSMGFLVDADQPLVWRGPMLHSAIQQFFTDVEWGALDYMVIDLPPGTGDAQLTLAQSVPLTGAIIVTQPQEVALSDALRGLVMFEKLNVPILGVVENMSGDFFGQDLPSTLSQKARNDAVALITSLAEAHGRNEEWAESAVQDAAAISAAEALEIGVIEHVEPDLRSVLREADGETVEPKGITLSTAGATLVEVPLNFRERFGFSRWFVIVPAILLLLALAGFVAFALRTSRWQVSTGREGMVGEVGVVRRPVGKDGGTVFVHGELWTALPEEPGMATIEIGTEVEVVSFRRTAVVVRPAE